MDGPARLAERVAADIRRQIVQGRWPAGRKLDSLRDHAQACGAAKNTVVKAYELLVAEGLVEPRRGSGYFVAGRDPAFGAADGWAPALDLAMSQAGIERAAAELATGARSLGEGLPPSPWLESCRLDRYMQKIGRSGLGTVFRYGNPVGYLPLRRNIAAKLQSHGIAAAPEQIILTQGAYQAVDLVVRHLVRPGDVVLVDDPGFYPTFGKLRLQGARLFGVRRTPHGPDLDQLAGLLRRHRPRLFFTQCCGHNPSGAGMAGATVDALVALAGRHGLVIVDDDALADFAPAGAPRVGARDGLARSIHVGSFSKSLSSVVRVGFLACNPALAKDLVQVKTTVSLNSSLYAERTVDAVITEGRFGKHVLGLRAHARTAMRSVLQVFDRWGVEVFARPKEGLYLWARLPGVDDSLVFTRAMLARGIAMAPGAVFRPGPAGPCPWFRFNVGFSAGHPRLEEVLAAARQWPAGPRR